VAAQRIATPPSIYIALGLMALAIAAPFIGAYVSDRTPGEGTMILGVFFEWLLISTGAGFVGIVCTVVGAWHAPRTGLTIFAMVSAALLVTAVLTLLSLLLR
jgi:hypothetical protein